MDFPFISTAFHVF